MLSPFLGIHFHTWSDSEQTLSLTPPWVPGYSIIVKETSLSTCAWQDVSEKVWGETRESVSGSSPSSFLFPHLQNMIFIYFLIYWTIADIFKGKIYRLVMNSRIKSNSTFFSCTWDKNWDQQNVTALGLRMSWIFGCWSSPGRHGRILLDIGLII